MGQLEYTEIDIRAHTTSKSFERGLQYYHDGAVRRVVRRGDAVMGSVEGSGYRPYRVYVTLSDGHIEAARCTCPYDWGGWCKHIVAVLLAMLAKPERVVERRTVEALLEPLGEEDLRDLVMSLAERYPRLVAKIERWVEQRIG